MKTIRLSFIATLLPFFCPAQAPTAFEDPVVIQAKDLLPQELLVGTSHRVRDQVVTDGYMAHFEIDTDFGVFKAVGVPQLKARIVEAEAMRKLAETSKSDLFAEGMKRSVTQPIDAAKNIVTKPVESIKKVPSTVGHFFSKVGASIERGASKAQNRDAGGGDASATQGSGLSSATGFDKAKLDTARQLGVDPYSDNRRLQEEMDKVTWAFFAGGLPLRIVAATASAGVSLAATKMVGIPEETYSLTASELALRDKQALTAMGVRGEDIEAFQIQPYLSITRRHRIVKSLEALDGVKGRGRIILLANACDQAAQVDFLVASLAMMAQRQRDGAARYSELVVLGRLPGVMTATGTLEVPAPVDHVTWTEQVATFAQRDDLGTAPRTLIHTGQLSPAATAGFTAAGWKTVAATYP